MVEEEKSNMDVVMKADTIEQEDGLEEAQDGLDQMQIEEPAKEVNDRPARRRAQLMPAPLLGSVKDRDEKPPRRRAQLLPPTPSLTGSASSATQRLRRGRGQYNDSPADSASEADTGTPLGGSPLQRNINASGGEGSQRGTDDDAKSRDGKNVKKGKRKGKKSTATGSRKGKKESRPKSPAPKPEEMQRWRTHRMIDDYVNLCGNIMYPHGEGVGYSMAAGPGELSPADTPAMLGILTHPERRPTVIEKWNPFEIAKFEGAMCVHGKTFHKVAAAIGTKTTCEVIEFYYLWKLTGHYKQWKSQYYCHEIIVRPPEQDLQEQEQDIGSEASEEYDNYDDEE